MNVITISVRKRECNGSKAKQNEEKKSSCDLCLHSIDFTFTGCSPTRAAFVLVCKSPTNYSNRVSS